MNHDVVDLFSAAAGGWSLGMHRAGFRTAYACEAVAWRRALYAENNPGVPIHDDVRTLTAGQLVSELGYAPGIVVGSPPCQDISSANAKGRGVDGERSGLFFEAVRFIGELKSRGGARWVALENSANLRTRGADRVLSSLEELGYTGWPVVVRAGHGRGGAGIGANHERPRAWVLAFDADQIVQGAVGGVLGGQGAQRAGASEYAAQVGHAGWRARGCGADGYGSPHPAAGAVDAADADQARQAHGRVESGLRQEEVTLAGRRDQSSHAPNSAQVRRLARAGDVQGPGGADDRGEPANSDGRPAGGEMGLGQGHGRCSPEPWADWNGGLTAHLQLDDGLSAWVAGARVAVGGPRGTAAASLLVEAFGDAVVPQIPEAIGRAILRVEAALAALYGRAAA